LSAQGVVTVGLDIGTTSIKGVAVDDDGAVVARSRIPHRLQVPSADRMEHDANQAWRRGPLRALAALGDVKARAVVVAAMAPSLTAVDGRGRALTPGLLYGDGRGRGRRATPSVGSAPGEAPGPGGEGELVEFLRWTAGEAPGAAAYWPAAAVANRALGGEPVIDLGVAFTALPLFGDQGWDAAICESCGASPEQLPTVAMPGEPAGRVGSAGPLLGAGTVDVWCEQLVAGADEPGDVHVICGTTLLIWAVTDTSAEAPGLWTVPHGVEGRHLVGGASNAGGLFLDWAGRLAGRPGAKERLDPAAVPIWCPFPRGERTPYHDPDRRASLHDLDLTHGPAALQRAAWEAAGFVVRHHLELAGAVPKRLVATAGGTRVEGWMQALADTTGVEVHVAAEPEGAARGAAFIARVAAGVETDLRDASRWARTVRVMEPDARWVAGCAERYARFVELSGSPGQLR